MQQLKRIALIFVILIACVGCDQTTKSLAREHLQGQAPISFLGDTVRLQYTQNPGAFLSLGASLPHRWGAALFTIGGAILVAAALAYALMSSRPGRLPTIGLALICGGGIGNLLDRLCYEGQVSDFLNLGIGSLRTGIFNVADMALMVGVALYLFAYPWSGRKKA